MPLTDEQKRAIIQENRQIIAQLQERVSFIGPREKGGLSRLSSFAKRAGSNILDLMATGRAAGILDKPEPLGVDVFSPFRPPVKEFGAPDPKQQTLAEQVGGVVEGGLRKWREATIPTQMAEVKPYSLEELDAILGNLAKGVSSVPRLAFDIPEQVFLDEEGKPRKGADIAKAAAGVGGEFATFPLTVFSDYALYLSPLSTVGQRQGAVERIAEHPEGLFFATAILKGGLKGARRFKRAVEGAIKTKRTGKPSPLAERLKAVEKSDIGVSRKVIEERLRGIPEPEIVRPEMQPILDQILQPKKRIGPEPLRIPEKTSPTAIKPDFTLGKEGRLMRTTKKRKVKVSEKGVEIRPGERRGPLYDRLKAVEEMEPGISRTRLAERLRAVRESEIPARRKLALKKKLKAAPAGKGRLVEGRGGIENVTRIIDRGVFREGISESIKKDGQKVIDATQRGDIPTLESLWTKYAKDKMRDQGGGGAGPGKVKQARRGGPAVWEAAQGALEKLRAKPPAGKAATKPAAKPPAKPLPSSVREPWEMTRGEFAQSHLDRILEISKEQHSLAQSYGAMGAELVNPKLMARTAKTIEKLAKEKANYSDPNWIKRQHKSSVKKALSEGKHPPEAVLKEYPELGKKPGVKAKLDLAEKKALDRMKKRGTRLTAGIDPAEMADLAIIGAAKIAKGTIKFGEWSAEMVREYGARVKPYLKRIYARSQQGASRLKANAELDSFIDYFEDIQAPKGLRPPRKPARAAIRERLREERLSGKELTTAANAEFIVEVNRYGVALRKTKGGKVTPAIREAGTYVPEDFATYPKFKDAKAGIFGGTKDATRFIQEIDGALSVEAKAKLPGQGGPAERYVLHRTRDMVKSKLTWTNAMKSRLATITEGASKKQLQTANQVIEHISREGAYVDPAKLVTNPKISALTTDLKVIRLAQEGRKLYESLLRHQNEFRRLIGRKEIPHRDYYTAHSIHETTIWERAVGHNKTPKQTIGPGLPDYIKPNAPFNARAMAREIGLPETVREMNLKVLLERYIETAGKDIYSTSIIQNNKAFIQQLESMGYRHAARGLENWTAEAFGGVKAAVDRAANLSPTIHKGMSRFRQGLIRSVFPLNFAWNTFVQTSSGVLTVTRYGARNSVKGLYDWFGSRATRQEIRGNAYSAIIKSQRSGRISRQDINRGIGAAQRLSRGKLEKASDAANFFTEWVERHLTGWSVATARRHGAAKGLKGKALWEYASEGGAKTQSMYNLEDLPGMLRSEVVKTGGPFQTFSFEVFNTLREYAGKTGTPPATSAIRIKMALRFLAGVTAVNYIGQAAIGRKPWELSSFIPFYGAFFAPVAAALKGEDVSMTSTRGLPSPIGIAIKGGQAAHKGLLKPGVAGVKELIRTGDINEAMEEFMATGKWDKLRRFTVRYLSGFAGLPGGTQMNRVVDGLIAVSAGGMVDSAGKLMFPITDTKDKMRTFLAGPWASKGGQEYWNKRGKEIDLYIESVNNTPLLRDVAESLPIVSDVYKFGPDSPEIRRFDAFLGRTERKVTRVKELDTREKKVKYLQENKKFFRIVGHKANGEPIRLPQALKKIDSRITKYRKQIHDIESDSLMVDKKPVKLTDKQKRLAISILKQKIEKLAKGALKLKK